MEQIKKNGILISLEGIEGCGKSTQKVLIEKYFLNLGYQVLVLREPGGTKLGEQVRDILLNLPSDANPLTEALLFAASRSELLHRSILPFLKNDKSVVILDRFKDSSFVYQGLAGLLGVKAIENIHSVYPLSIQPDTTFYYKISLETSLKRQDQRGSTKDYFESKSKDYYKKLIAGFDSLAQNEKDRIKTIDGEKKPEDVFKQTEIILKSLVP